jgi:hypothetical protein
VNRASKLSNYVSINQASAIVDAVLYAFCRAKWLNRFITIHFGKAGVRSYADARGLLEDFLKHAGDLLSKRGLGPPCYVYVFENPEGGGLNAHILLHVPFDEWHSFAKLERGWIKRAVKKLGGRYQKGVLDYEPVYYCREFMAGKASLSDFIEKGLLGSLLYLLKGGEAGTPSLLGLDADAVSRLSPKLRPSPQGIISGKRVGFAEALSRTQHFFPRREIRPGIWMSGREAHARATLRAFGLEFVAPNSRAPGYPHFSRV